MVVWNGKDWTREELVRWVGSMDQLAGVRLLEASEGKARGSRILEVWTGSGLTFDVLADRALDISSCRYKGVAVAWRSMVGDVHPSYYEPGGLGWLRSFQGGLVATCGLDQFGSPVTDGGEEFGIHGRVSSLPARFVGHRAGWEGQDYILEITGEVRQARVFGKNVVLRRAIRTALGSSCISIRDTVINDGFVPQPHMILYHFNLGYPLLSQDTRLMIDAVESSARDVDAAAGVALWREFQPPTPGYREQVFHHLLRADAGGQAVVEVANRALGLGVRWTIDARTLPHVFEWKQMGEGMYVLGVEPANCGAIEGRTKARETGDLPLLGPGESVDYAIDVEVVEYE